jgi:hypothetical protein
MHYLVNWWRQHWKRWNLSKRLKLAEEINYTWSILRSVCCLIKINLILKWPNNIAQNLANGRIREKNVFSKWHLIQTLYATIHQTLISYINDIMLMQISSLISYTLVINWKVKPVYKGHSREPENEFVIIW